MVPLHALVSALLPLAVAPHASFTKLPSGNGWGTAVYDVAAGKVVDLREHVYQSVDSGVPTRDLVYDTYFGLRASGQSTWLPQAAGGTAIEQASLDGGVITATQHALGLAVTTAYVAPFGIAAPSVLLHVEVKNEGAQPIDDVHLFSLHNLHLGDGDGTMGQRIDWDSVHGGYVHKSTTSQRVALVLPLTTVAHHTATPQNPYTLLQADQFFPDVDSSGDGNDMASGYQFDVGTLGPGQTASADVVILYHPFGDVNGLALMASTWQQQAGSGGPLAFEQANWAAWIAKARVPSGLSSDEEKLYRQQLAILRMAQVREPNDLGASYLPSGQIVASLRPGKWDIAWVRDGCLAIAALARAGYLDEARAALEFMLNATAGLYQSYVGKPYRISVVRYLGRGKEESDSNQDGPNIELDGFGMFLWATGEWLDAGGDPSFLDQWWSAISTGTADVLAGLVEESSGLVAADSSIWETHWDNGGRQHYTWTDAWAAAGLERAAAWADRRDPTRAAAWRRAANAIRGSMASRLVAGNVLRPSVEATAKVDAAAAEALNLGVVDPTGPVAQATLDAFDGNLRVASGNGYKRNQNGSSYDESEWIVVDLRVSEAMRLAGRTAQSDALWGWVRDQALANHGLVPELYDPTTADYAGEVPMAGFGAGAYVVTAWDRARPIGQDGGVATDAGGGDLGTMTNPGGCSCSTGNRGVGAGAAALAALALVGAALRRRRS